MLDRIKKNIDKSIAVVGVQSTTYMESSKLRSKISHVSAQVSEAVSGLGEVVLEQWKNGSFDEKVMSRICEEIHVLEKEIEDYETKISELEEEKDKVITGGKKHMTGNRFCSSCGRPLEEGVKFCAGCGAEIKM